MPGSKTTPGLAGARNDATGPWLQPPRARARAITILLGPPPVHSGAFIGSRPARARPSGQKYVDKLPPRTPFGVIPLSIRHTVTSQGFRAFQTFRKRHTVFGCDG